MGRAAKPRSRLSACGLCKCSKRVLGIQHAPPKLNAGVVVQEPGAENETAMRRKLYAVVRQNGRWGISAGDAPFLSCDSYQEALDVAVTAAAALTRQRRQRSASRDEQDCSEDSPE